jgi:hypothetical protein
MSVLNSCCPGKQESNNSIQGTSQASNNVEALDEVYQEDSDSGSPPEADVTRRTKSYSDLRGIVKPVGNKRKRRRKDYDWNALNVAGDTLVSPLDDELHVGGLKDALLEASQQDVL